MDTDLAEEHTLAIGAPEPDHDTESDESADGYAKTLLNQMYARSFSYSVVEAIEGLDIPNGPETDVEITQREFQFCRETPGSWNFKWLEELDHGQCKYR